MQIAKYIFHTITIATILSLNNACIKNPYQQKRIPLKNAEILNSGSSHPQDNEKPKTRPLFAVNEAQNKQSFYKDFFNKKEKLTIRDEVSSNNLPTIKKQISQNKTKKTPQIQINKPVQRNITKNRKTAKSSKDQIVVQLGAYSNRNNALALRNKIPSQYQNLFITKKIQKNDKNLTRVQIGPFSSPVQALDAKKELKAIGFNNAIIVKN